MKGIIFDMDGTIIDNMMIHHRVWQKHLQDLGIEMTLEEVKDQIHGVNIEILERLFGDKFTPEQRVELSDQKEAKYREIYASEIKLLDGLPALLEELKAAEVPLAIGTAAPGENADFVLDTLNLRPYFKSVVHSYDVQHGKPNPEVFEKAAAGMGLQASDCLIFEDSITGAETAKNAGATAIVVTTTHAKEEFAHFDHIHQFINDYTGINWAYLKETFGF